MVQRFNGSRSDAAAGFSTSNGSKGKTCLKQIGGLHSDSRSIKEAGLLEPQTAISRAVVPSPA